MLLRELKKYILSGIFIIAFALFSVGQQSASTEYQDAINKGDEYFQKGDYINAKTSYSYASRLRPDEQYPKDKLKATVDQLREKMAKMEQYTILLSAADNFFREGDFDNARKKYEEAGKLIPSEGYPSEKIEEIENLINAKRRKQATYDDAIYRADKFIKYKKYKEAISEFEKALAIFPEEQYPKDKIAELNIKIVEVEETLSSYDEIIGNADRLFLLKYYEGAKSEYLKASEAMPEEKYPLDQIAEIDVLLEKKTEYNQLIDAADEFYMAKNLDDAKKKYQEGLTIYPSESYPKDMIDKINTSLMTEVGEDELYDKSIKSADLFLAGADYTNALTEYENAGRIKPRETYPQQKIAEVNKILSDLESADVNYTMAIKKGDQFLAASDFSNAKSEYEKAQEIKPNEKYPVEQLAIVATNMKQQEAVMASYNQSISKADAFFEAEEYESAVEQYQNAIVILPGNEYASKKLKDIELIWQEKDAGKLLYTQLIADADKFLDDGKYQDAKDKYNEAIVLDQSQEYPVEKVAEIDVIMQKMRETENDYAKAIATADIFFKNNESESALAEYQKAASLKPNATYPQQQIAEINSVLLADVDKKNEEYDKTIAEADVLLGELNYEEAKMVYLKASYMKPYEEYPKAKMQEIETIINEKDATQAKYNMLVAAADRMMEAEEYDKAKAKYEEALVIFPNENYPKEKIAAIGSAIVAGELAVQESYNVLITEADGYFDSQDYATATIKYKNALKYKPGETYPTQRLEEIETLSHKLDQQQDNYSQLIAAADRAYSGREYQEAKTKYMEASAMFPEEEHPKERINEINLIFKADFQKEQQAYDKAIADADKFFAAGDLGKSMDGYKQAKYLIPDETYPDQMIAKILQILNDNAVRKIVTSAVMIEDGQEREFKFDPMAYADRSSSMLFIQVQNQGDSEFKLFVSYGKDASKNGGYSLPVPAGGEMKEFLIPLGNQHNWSSKDNDWIKLTTQGGSAEIRRLEIIKQD